MRKLARKPHGKLKGLSGLQGYDVQQIQVQSQSTLETMIVPMQQSMIKFMSFMKATMKHWFKTRTWCYSCVCA